MVSISGSKKLKRQMAPLFWGITRKDKRFVCTVRPGPHSKHYSVPSAVFLRDMLGIVSSMREAKSAIYGGRVSVDGVKRRSLHHGIGLMDVVKLEGMSEAYRLVPADGSLLKPIRIPDQEERKKICRINSKTTISGGKTQLGLHDGRSIISDADVRIGDSVLLKVPEQEVLDVISLSEKCQAVVVRGANAGQTGTVTELKDGTFMLPRMATMQLGERTIQIPTDIIMVTGRDAPVIRIR
jgi:small subunit ribosomal protein S4e